MTASIEDDRTVSLLRYIMDMFHLEITPLVTREDITAFCGRHCFHSIQKELTSAGLQSILEQADTNFILQISDQLCIHMLLLSLENRWFVAGPFCTVLFSRWDAERLFTRNKITGMNPMDFLFYTSGYPQLPEKQAHRIIRCLLHVLYPKEDDRPIISISPQQMKEPVNQDPSEAARANYALLLDKRYAYEKAFRKGIAEGIQKAALWNLEMMEQDVAYLKRIGSTIESEKTGCAIARTTARLAAVDAGLPGIVADRIAGQNTREVQHARTIEDILRAKERMVCDYCSAMRTLRKQNYSALVQSILYEMKKNYGQAFSLDNLASELAISKNHLIQKFRTEVGQTPIQYLTGLRMKEAASMIKDRSLTIQEVAAKVGIPDANYFTKLFKKEFGVTPAQYRKQSIV